MELNSSFVTDLLADLFAALLLRSHYDLKSMLMSHFTEVPFSALDPLIEGSYLRLFRVLLDRSVLSAADIVELIRASYGNGPEFVIGNIVLLLCARAIQAADAPISASLFRLFECRSRR
jgi:hypothetical protein